MKILGKHLVVEYTGCSRDILDNSEVLEQSLTEAVRRAGATIVNCTFHRYNPQGVSGMVVIAESHMSIHTWPEYGYAAVDFFTCGDECDPRKAHEYMMGALECKSADVRELKRGMPSEQDEHIRHKQASQLPRLSPQPGL